MNDNILKIQVTVEQMKRMLSALQGISEEMPKNPRLYAFMAEAPLVHLSRMCDEIDQHLTELKQPAAASTS
jgi:hypothetical protein